MAAVIIPILLIHAPAVTVIIVTSVITFLVRRHLSCAAVGQLGRSVITLQIRCLRFPPKSPGGLTLTAQQEAKEIKRRGRAQALDAVTRTGCAVINHNLGCRHFVKVFLSFFLALPIRHTPTDTMLQ